MAGTPWQGYAQDHRPAMPRECPRKCHAQGTDFTHAINGFADAVASLTKRAESAEERADRAELATTELRTKIEQLQAELTAAEAGRGQAETDARELRAHEAALQLQLAETTATAQGAEALRQADDARKARGLLARLRAAVRGE